jgi:hypothetical protein
LNNFKTKTAEKYSKYQYIELRSEFGLTLLITKTYDENGNISGNRLGRGHKERPLDLEVFMILFYS